MGMGYPIFRPWAKLGNGLTDIFVEELRPLPKKFIPDKFMRHGTRGRPIPWTLLDRDEVRATLIGSGLMSPCTTLVSLRVDPCNAIQIVWSKAMYFKYVYHIYLSIYVSMYLSIYLSIYVCVFLVRSLVGLLPVPCFFLQFLLSWPFLFLGPDIFHLRPGLAFAKRVFPHPGGPNRRTPTGTVRPQELQNP